MQNVDLFRISDTREGVTVDVPLEEDQGIVVLYSRKVVVIACNNTRPFFCRSKELLSEEWGAVLLKFI